MPSNSKLEDLYSRRKVLTEYGYPIPSELSCQIEEEEKNLFDNYINPLFGEIAPGIIDIKDIDSDVIVALVYKGGKLTRIASSMMSKEDFHLMDMNVSEVGQDVCGLDNSDNTDISPEAEDDETSADNTVPHRISKRSQSIPFKVKFPDGYEVFDTNAQLTMVESLRHFGLDKASKYTYNTFSGYNLVGKSHRLPGTKWQKEVDGWWIYTNMSNQRKIDCLIGIAEMLNVPIVITYGDETITPHIQQSQSEIKPENDYFYSARDSMWQAPIDLAVANESNKDNLYVCINNRVIRYKKSQDTFLETLNEIGFDKLRPLDIKVDGMPLFSEERHPKHGALQRKLRDGSYVLCKMHLKDYIVVLDKISKLININLNAYLK